MSDRQHTERHAGNNNLNGKTVSRACGTGMVWYSRHISLSQNLCASNKKKFFDEFINFCPLTPLVSLTY